MWMKRHPKIKGKHRAYSALYEDLLGRQRLKDELNAFTADRSAGWLEKCVVEARASLLGLDDVEGMKEKGGTRLFNKYDPAAVLDSSAKVSYDSAWLKNWVKGFGHDFHNLANQYQGFEGDGGRPGGTDQTYRRQDETKTAKIGSSRYDADKVAPKMNTVSKPCNIKMTEWFSVALVMLPIV